MSYPLISLQIVTWNSMRFLPELLESIMGQTYKNFNVLIIDSASTDGVEKFLRETYPEITFLRNPRNLGFCAAQNQGIRYVTEHWPSKELKDRFVLTVSPNALLSETFLENIIAVTKAHPEVGVFGGKLLRAFGENLGDEVFKETIRSDRFDSVGLIGSKNRKVSHRGAGEMDEGQFDKQELVFGISGVLALYRASALGEIRYKDSVLDNDFGSYQEDVDMAWRLQHAGWDALYVPSAVAYHYRGLYDPEGQGLRYKIRNRRLRSVFQNYFSTRNHWFVLVKSLRISNLLLSLPRILVHECVRVVYVVIFEPKGLRAVVEFVKYFPRMIKKRVFIMRSSKRSAKDLRKWFQG
jgi:GT2 family glycosyltransferase